MEVVFVRFLLLLYKISQLNHDFSEGTKYTGDKSNESQKRKKNPE